MNYVPIVVTKLDAAKRQLRTAIALWFTDGDPIAVHTLAAAAHEIIHTLYRRKGLSGLMFDSPLIRDDMRSEFARGVKAIATFFKHAQRDPDAALVFNPAINDSLLLFTAYGLHLMGEPHEMPENALIIWFMLREPTWFQTGVFSHAAQIEGFDRFRNIDRGQFFELFKLSERDGAVTHSEILAAMRHSASNS